MVERAARLWDVFEARVAATPQALAAADELGRERTWAELHRGACEVAAGLAALGVADGTVVSWQLPAWIETVELTLALSGLGAIQNPLVPTYRAREIEHICGEAGTQVLLVPSVLRGHDHETEARRGIEGLDRPPRIVVCDHQVPRGAPGSAAPAPDHDPGSTRWYSYTSGTTSRPKGARHSDAGILASSRGMVERLGLGTADRQSMVFPFTHIGGVAMLNTSVLSGSRMLYVERFDPSTTIELMAAFGITIAGAGAPFFLAYLRAQQARPDEPIFPALRTYCGGGAPVPPRLHHELLAASGAGVCGVYGLTEAPMVTISAPEDTDAVRAHTSGRGAGGAEVRIVVLGGAEAAVGDEGEVRVRGPQVMQGYLDPVLDADAFDDQGWFRTGDLGRLDPAGNLTITGRMKDTIIRNMENISALEVELVLEANPAIAEVAVVGLPDERTGERVCAVVVPAPGSDGLDLAALVTWCTERGLMRQKCPEQLAFSELLPRNAMGKVVKAALRHELASESGR